MALYGPDLSHYQPTSAVDGDYDFVILKATEGFNDGSGPGYVDPDCNNKYQRAKSQGKLLGVYGYAIMLDAVKEATFFVDNIQGYLGEALLALDNETHTDVNFALTWLNTVYSLTQVKPMIYMSASTAKAVDWSPVVNAGYALWEAGYPSQFNIANPGMPRPDGADMPYSSGAWPFATIWQYSSSAGTLDRDIAYMTADAWHKFAQGDRATVTTPEPTPPTVLQPPVVDTPPDNPVTIPVTVKPTTPVVVNDPLLPTPVTTTSPPSSTSSTVLNNNPVVVEVEKEAVAWYEKYAKGVVAFMTTAFATLATWTVVIPPNAQHWTQFVIAILGSIGVIVTPNKT
jgi:lysozyme